MSLLEDLGGGIAARVEALPPMATKRVIDALLEEIARQAGEHRRDVATLRRVVLRALAAAENPS